MEVGKFVRLVSQKMEAAVAFYLENNRWPHQYSDTCGATFVDQASAKTFFEMDPRKAISPLSEGVRLLNKYQGPRVGSADDRSPYRALQFTYKRPLVYVTKERIYDFLREMFDEVNAQAIMMTVQCRREIGDVFPMFFDIDEEVEDPARFVSTDRYVEGVMAALMEMIYPGVHWWWARATHVRKTVDKADGKTKYKGGVHIHTEAVTTAVYARVIAEWVHTYREPYATGEFSHITLDMNTYNRAGCFRPMLSYKSMRCPLTSQNSRGCSTTCDLCRGAKEILTSPPYLFAAHANTFENFLWSTMFVPDGAPRTPCAPEVEASVSLYISHPKQKRGLAVILRRYGSLESTRGGCGDIAPSCEVHLKEILAARGRHGRTTADYGKPYLLAEGAIIVPTLSRNCVFMTEQKKAVQGNRGDTTMHEHKSNRNFYVVSKTGAIFLRCHSKKDPACYETRPPPLYELTDEEYMMVFGAPRISATSAYPAQTPTQALTPEAKAVKGKTFRQFAKRAPMRSEDGPEPKAKKLKISDV
jgi:hypothetical protein